MASSSLNGVTLYYPDSPCMVWNPCIMRLTGTFARTQVYVSQGGESYSAVYQTPNGGYIDVREYLKGFFDGSKMGGDLDYQQSVKGSELGKSVNITIKALSSDGTTKAQFNITIFVVWGGLKPLEQYNQPKTVTWFKAFPFMVGRYFAAAETLDFGYYQNGQVSPGTTISITSAGVKNITIDTDFNSGADMLSIAESVSPYTEYFRIKVDRKHDEGIYLRWVDRQGFWQHWLFKQGDPQRVAASRFGNWDRINYSLYNQEDKYHEGVTGRRQSLTRNDVIPCCAPLVDQETFDFLQDVTTSPCVDIFLGYDAHDVPMWTGVTIQPGTYTKDVKKPEQDFIFNVVLPEIPIQSL